MEINEGCHSCDLHQESGSTTDPGKYGPKSGWGKGGHTHTQKKKKKRKGKERHLKMDICEKTKETTSFWMHLKDSQQTEWTEFCIFASHS